MTAKRKTESPNLAGVRSKANPPRLRLQPTPRMLPGDAEKLIHELEVQNQELREKQQEIEEARRRYLDLYDFAPIGYFVFNQKGTIVELNLSGAKLLGLPKNQLIGMPFPLFLIRESISPFYQHLKKVFSSNIKETCELRMNQKYQKSVISVSVESMALNADQGTTCRSAVIDITKRKLAEQELIEAREELVKTNGQLRHLSAHLFESQEEERRLVASDVHDSFASQLCFIKDELQPLLGKGKKGKLNRVLSQLDIAIRDAIRIQMTLRPPLLEDVGLLPALKMLCREFQNSHPRIRVEKQLLLEEGEIPDSIETPIYRLTQEALENIATHSSADLVIISLTRKDSFIELAICDNGREFNVEEMLTRSGTERGLLTMRERAVLSGGLFDIESADEKGTTIRVSWPFA